jgi:EAL domain-containing protein (putative c-di-GMP-specific phosphodiesterase class I)
LKKNLSAFLLLLFFTPVAHYLSPTYLIADRIVYLCYLPYGLAIAAIYIFGRAAVLPLYLTFFITFQFCFSAFSLASALTFTFLTPLLLACWLARRCLGRRWRYNPGNRGVGIRLILINTLAPTLTLMLLAGFSHYLPAISEMSGSYFVGELNMYSILSLQNLILSAVVFTIPFYFALRILAHPRYARLFFSGLKMDCFRALFWFNILALLMLLLCSPLHYPLISGYLVPLIFVAFTYGIMRFKPQLVLCLWAACCLLLMRFNLDVLPINSIISATFLSSTFIAFTISLLYIATGYWHSRHRQQIALYLSLTDPMLNRPNLRALVKDLKKRSSGTLCYLYLHQLKILGCYYGIMMRIYSKRCIIDEIARHLGPDEGVYQIAGDGVMLLLQGEDITARLTQLRVELKKRPIFWHQQLIDIDYAFVASRFNAGENNLYHLITQLTYLADHALAVGGMLLLDKNNADLIGQVSERVLLLQKIKQAITQRDIVLFAQPIVACKKDERYYEVLARLTTDNGLLTPDRFLPLITEFRLGVAFDNLVTEETVAFIHRRRAANNPPPCLAINLMPVTLTEPGIADTLIALFRQFAVPPEAVIFEVTEEQSFMNNQLAHEAVVTLRQAGFRIALDDFGSGFANYERVKDLNADIIKIDGQFVKNSLTDNLDRIIIKSICDIAQEKGISVVAEYVESEAQRTLLTELGVDYVQGWLTGQPARIETIS